MATVVFGATFSTRDGQPLNPQIAVIGWYWISEAKGEYKHFMQKQIYMQAYSPADSIRGRAYLACVIALAGRRPEGVIRYFPTFPTFSAFFTFAFPYKVCYTVYLDYPIPQQSHVRRLKSRSFLGVLR
jgi:hypothetical protein